MSGFNEPVTLCKLFIRGLSFQTTELSLKSYFEQWGEVIDCIIVKDRVTGASRGFGFLTYKRAQMVDKAQQARPHKIDGREVESRRASPIEDSGKPESQIKINKLYVSGVKDDLTENDLREYFGTYGNIKTVNFAVDKDSGKRRGIAFVEFDDYDPVDKIVLLNHNYKGRDLKVKKGFNRDEMNSMLMKKKIAGFGRGREVGGRGRGVGGRGGWRAADEFHTGGYGADTLTDNFVLDSYSSGVRGTWDSDYSQSYGRGIFRSSTGYSYRSRGPYNGGRARSGAYEWR